MELFAIYDRKVGTYLYPFFQQNSAAAQRFFVDGCRDSNSLLHAHPDDFYLVKIASFCLDTGVISDICNPPAHIMDAVVIREDDI